MVETITTEQNTEANPALSRGQDFFNQPTNGRGKRYNAALFTPFGEEPKNSAAKTINVAHEQSMATTPQNAPVYDPNAKMDPAEYSKFIQEFNDKIDASPMKGSVHVFDLSKHATYEDLLAGMRDVFKDKPQETRDGLQKHLRTAFFKEEKHDAFTVSSPSNDPNTPGYAAMAMPDSPERTTWDVFLKDFTEFGVAPNEWAKNMSTNFAQHFSVGHEAYHALNGRTNGLDSNNKTLVDGHTFKVLEKQHESAADVFSILYLAQQNEPDLDHQLQALIQIRSSGVITGGRSGLDHYSSDALRQLAKDLPKLRATPGFADMPLGELVAQADKYSRDSIRKDYPHLYTNEGQGDENSLRKSKATDMKLGSAADYAYKKIHEPDKHVAMESLDSRQAALLLDISESFSAVSGNPKHGLAEGIKQLRTQFPQAFKEAEKEMGSQHQSGLDGNKHTTDKPHDKAPPRVISSSAFSP